MSSRKQSQTKPYWKKRRAQAPGYYTQRAFTEMGGEMVEVRDEFGRFITREVPNRALKRRVAADLRRGK
jgi:hypothetical protein